MCFRAVPNVAESGWREVMLPGHFVQIYDQPEHLLNSLAEYTADGLWQGERVLVILTPAHRSELERRLRENGVDVSSTLVTRQFIALDAEETLARFMVGARPDPTLFQNVVGTLVKRSTRGGRALRAFGEMVALSMMGGNPAGALQLEQLWNQLAREVHMTLFCAYHTSCFADDASGKCLADICQAHARVIPPESYAA